MRVIRKSTIYLLAVSGVVLLQVANVALFALWWFRDRAAVVARVNGLNDVVCAYTNHLDALVLCRLDALDAVALSARNRNADSADTPPPPRVLGVGRNKTYFYTDYAVTSADGTESTQRVYTRRWDVPKPSNGVHVSGGSGGVRTEQSEGLRPR